MNIVYISKYTGFPEHKGGTRQYFLSKHLAQNNENEQVLLIGSRSSLIQIPAFKGLAIEKKENNLSTTVLNGPEISLGFNPKRIYSWLLFEFNLWRYRNKIREFKPDVIVVSSLSILTFLTGVFLKKWLKVPLVLEVRDIYPLTLVEVGGYSKKHPAVRILGWIEKWGYKNADLLMSTLPNADEHFRNVLKRDFHFKWLPMGVDLNFFDTSKNQKDKFFIRKSNEFIIGYAGTIGKVNALDTIFETAKEIEQSHPHIKFAFVGNGPLKEFHKNQYGGLSNVIFHDAVPKQDLQPILDEMDVLINTWLDQPIYRFGISPNKWIDYMLAAKPILLSFSGYDHLIEKAKCGLVIPAENKKAMLKAVIQLSEMPKEDLKQMGENGKNYLLNHLQYKDLAKELKISLEEVVKGLKKP